MLKRETIGGRKARREGRREDAVRTAGKLLGVQMRRRAEEEERRRRDDRDRGRERDQEEEVLPENLVYVDELEMTVQERVQNRAFRKTDAYHLPALDVSLADMGAPNDPRVMSHEELEEYARQFHTGEDINLYDFSKIDFNGPFFMSLPASDRYNILNAARLRSRLRMGYSKEQLDGMFPDRMAFSKFQIERVAERNELTQRLMNINGANGEDAMFGSDGGGRVAGEKEREYVLVKNDGVEGGWALGVVSNKGEGERNKPIDVEEFGKETATQEDEEDEWEDDGFEDVPIEGLNRLPKRRAGASALDVDEAEEATNQRQALYKERQNAVDGKRLDTTITTDDTDSLFIPQEVEAEDEDMDGLFQNVPNVLADEDEDLSRAIAMSLEQPGDPLREVNATSSSALDFLGPRIDQPLEFNQRNAEIGRNFAHSWNAKANLAATKSMMNVDTKGDDVNLQGTLDESRGTMHKSQSGPEVFGLNSPDRSANGTRKSPEPKSVPTSVSPTQKGSQPLPIFDGPLPFESLNLGKSILGRKKKEVVEEDAGGFEKESTLETRTPAQPLPPWFSGDIRETSAAQKALESHQREDHAAEVENQTMDRTPLNRQETGEVISIDSPRDDSNGVIEVDSSNAKGGDDIIMGDIRPIDAETRMGNVGDLTRAEPAFPEFPLFDTIPSRHSVEKHSNKAPLSVQDSSDSEVVEWEESDLEDDRPRRAANLIKPSGGSLQTQSSTSASPEFENVRTIDSPTEPQQSMTQNFNGDPVLSPLPTGESLQDGTLDDLPPEEEGFYSDPEDEDLLRQLAIEAEEHARFASTLSSHSQLQSAEDYEKELRQLRSQQKKDRRDADEVSHIMITECQQLLKLFGLPYVTAPMEAEAQCAELVSLGLVDGIVTDDSDIFLFGGTRVYKNMFNQAKFVECYLSSDLEKEYSLDRQKLIRIAHLLGSDYTEGLPSVGPVTALEILSEFETLEEFSEWWSTVQMGQPLSAEDASNSFRRKFRRNATKIFLPAVFPDKRVEQAYLHPEVDRDPSPFAWGVPDLDALRQFLMATIGWTQERTDEVLVPVIKDMNRRENEGTQANITQFFSGSVGIGGRPSGGGVSAFAPRRRGEGKSKRMESALGRLQQQAKNRTVGEGDDSATTAGETRDTDGVTPENTSESAESRKVLPKSKSNKRAAVRDGSMSNSDSANDAEHEALMTSRKRGKAGGTARKMARSSQS